MFTVAMNGFDKLFKHHLTSHQAYAERMGFTYHVIRRPKLSVLGKELVWLKLTLMLKALEHGYDWVLFLDADTQVQAQAPNILHEAQPGKSFYLANGFSGRLNSGVMLVRNTPEAKAMLEKIINSALMPLPIEDDVGWGENGHVLHCLKNSAMLQQLSCKWNNNHDPELADYIRHFSHGPLYPLCQQDWQDLLWVRLLKFVQKFYVRFSRQSFQSALSELTTLAIKQNSIFTEILDGSGQNASQFAKKLQYRNKNA